MRGGRADRRPGRPPPGAPRPESAIVPSVYLLVALMKPWPQCTPERRKGQIGGWGKEAPITGTDAHYLEPGPLRASRRNEGPDKIKQACKLQSYLALIFSVI